MNYFMDYFSARGLDIENAVGGTIITVPHEPIEYDSGLHLIVSSIRDAKKYGVVLFIGNGGSAAICSHAALDLMHKASIAALTLDSPPMLTCFGNDYGYDNVYAEPILRLVSAGLGIGCLVAVSSSGESDNIINAVELIKNVRCRNCSVVTFTGFDPENRLRKQGDVNVWVPSSEYGIVETVHGTLVHMITDYLIEGKEE